MLTYSDKGVTISRSPKSNSGHRVRHLRAVAIFASNNRGGLSGGGNGGEARDTLPLPIKGKKL